MLNNYYFEDLDNEVYSNHWTSEVLEDLKSFAQSEKKQVYVVDRPISDAKEYMYPFAIVVLIPGYKIIFINLMDEPENFDIFKEDFIEDLGYISDKYSYKKFLGRPREWKNNLLVTYNAFAEQELHSFIRDNAVEYRDVRKISLLISLITGSINDIDRVAGEIPTNRLEQVKKNIILFDGEQTRFIFNKKDKKRITIQGLAGAGKTELLLHKLKNIYTSEENSKIVLTCFSKVLSANLKERIPKFFDFMKVEEQIKWDERLWVSRGWGSRYDSNSGVYSFICDYYNIPFKPYSFTDSFESVCNEALEKIEDMEKEGSFEPCFDYILIDESQDFSEAFFKLCEKVTKKQVYIAGDIFQNIFDYNNVTERQPDYLLNRVYRTDPRTLMFAHALGFGLLEKPVIRWLNDDEWKACGYIIEKKDNNYRLSREPLNRFDGLGDDFNSMQVKTAEGDEYLEEIMASIEDIRRNNPTVGPEDIGVVFLENEKMNYDLVEKLIIKLDQKFGWEAIKGYEEKYIKKNTLFISNRNNIKGLEFPFIICITTSSLKTNTMIRNSLYMMLTRSFLTSYLILSKNNGTLNDKFISTSREILQTGILNVEKPNEDEVMDQSELMLMAEEYRSQRDIVTDLLEKEFNIYDPEWKGKMLQLVSLLLGESMDIKEIQTVIKNNIDHLKDN